ncbi:MAG: hypothetical protein ACREHD_08800 [Pirellulales bacterium]
MAILRRIVDTDQPYLSADAARDILRLDFSKSDHRRMNQLAAKNRAGKLTAAEEEALDNYIRVGQTLGILKSKARRTLRGASKANGKKPRPE